MTFRRRMRLLQQQAARMGVEGAEDFFDMTPYEISLRLRAFAASRHCRVQEMYAGAHLAALAFHAPRQLPAMPSSAPSASMTPDEMKQRLLSGRRKDEHT
ncbi:MAG: hypothetical protein IJB69_02410 [Clostridia bacterium]|nr:hypothetical protein [Clostridia bacterium]